MKEKPSSQRHRWPHRVYGVGTEPDPRFTLANERTFLAWIRTSLAILAAGVAIEEFQFGDDPALRLMASIILVFVGASLAVYAFTRWMSIERAMRQSLPLPGLRSGFGLAIFLAIVAVLIVLLFLA